MRTTPTTQRMKAAMQAYVDGLNRGDAEAVIALFAEDPEGCITRLEGY